MQLVHKLALIYRRPVIASQIQGLEHAQPIIQDGGSGNIAHVLELGLGRFGELGDL